MSVSSANTSSELLSTQLLNSSSGLSSNSTLTNSGAGGTTQITGLASGINTTELIEAELAEQELPLNNEEANIESMQTENSVLGTIQNMLQDTSLDALDLSEPSLFFLQQTVSSSDTGLVTATSTQNVGAVIGSTTIEVAQLAGASQATYNFTSPTGSAGDTLSVQVGSGTAQTINVAAGETATTLANDINGSSTLGVWASVTNGQLTLSSRTTGTGNTITASTADTSSGTGNSDLSEVSSQDGQDAEIYVNGATTAVTSATDTVTNAIPGVTLNLTGVTPAASPVTITTASPAPDTDTIVQAVEQFVNDYNDALEVVEGQINSAPPGESNSTEEGSDPGSLYGDPELENLLDDMRNTISTTDPTQPAGFQSLQQLGISTGSSSGEPTTDSTDGFLTIDTATLEQAIQSNPTGVEQALSTWSSSFQTVINTAASPTGSIETRINGNNTLISSMQNQLTSMTELYDQQEKNMEEQWAQVEATLEDLDQQKTSLTSFASSLSSESSSSS
jgi:flagellar hook-associated protein 2